MLKKTEQYHPQDAIWLVLSYTEPKYGLDIVKECKEKGYNNVKSGSVYGHLFRLVSDGYAKISYEKEVKPPGSAPRALYTKLPKGRHVRPKVSWLSRLLPSFEF